MENIAIEKRLPMVNDFVDISKWVVTCNAIGLMLAIVFKNPLWSPEELALVGVGLGGIINIVSFMIIKWLERRS
jgi:hypothetical protein